MIKREVYSSNGILPEGTPEGLLNAGTMVDGKWEPGFICYGAPIGSDQYVLAMLDEKLAEVKEEVKKMCVILKDERQALWTVLRSSISKKLYYWLSLKYPSLL